MINNDNRLKKTIDLTDLYNYICRFFRLKKYEYLFNDKLIIYEKVIQEILGTKDIRLL